MATNRMLGVSQSCGIESLYHSARAWCTELEFLPPPLHIIGSILLCCSTSCACPVSSSTRPYRCHCLVLVWHYNSEYQCHQTHLLPCVLCYSITHYLRWKEDAVTLCQGTLPQVSPSFARPCSTQVKDVTYKIKNDFQREENEGILIGIWLVRSETTTSTLVSEQTPDSIYKKAWWMEW